MKFSNLWIAAAGVLLFGCPQKNPRPSNEVAKDQGPALFSELWDFETEVFPLPNGNAYLVSRFDKQLFLLSGDRAKRIDGIQLSPLETTVYPLPDSAAYLASSDGSHLRLYYLVADRATLVQEGAIASAALERTPSPSVAFLWTQLQAAVSRERRTRKLASGQHERLQYELEPDDRPEPYPR